MLLPELSSLTLCVSVHSLLVAPGKLTNNFQEAPSNAGNNKPNLSVQILISFACAWRESTSHLEQIKVVDHQKKILLRTTL